MFVLIEYVEKTETEFRKLKTNAFMVSIVLIIALCVIAGMQALAQAKEPVTTIAPEFSRVDFVQLTLTVFSVLCGLYLYCLTQINEMKDLFVRLKDGGRSGLRADMASNVQQQYGLKV